MPRFGQDCDVILKGMCKLIISLGNGQQGEQCALWLKQALAGGMEALDNAFNSTYMANKLVEQKIHCFALLMKTLYTYGSDPIRNVLRDFCLAPRIDSLMARYEQNLMLPLYREEGILLSE